MKIKQTPLQGAFVIELDSFKDERGIFTRIFCQNELRNILHRKKIVQINHSITRRKGTIRGMHFQHPPKAEVKIVKCLRGSIFDVIVDLRKDSATFLNWHGEFLSVENMKMMFIPEGFAHGFQTLGENCELLYLHSAFYNPRYEGGVRYDDPRIGVSWPLEVTDISHRDLAHPFIGMDFEGISL